MLHVGETAESAESKLALGSPETMRGRKTVPNTTHFRTIAPKVAPKIVPSFSSSGFPPSLSDVAVPGVKPLVINPQNYTLMKVAAHDGTFSLVALPQITSAMGGSVIQTTGVPSQENLKLPIPRYQPARSKRFLNKKTKGKPKAAESIVQVNEDGPSEATTRLMPKTKKAKPLKVAEEPGLESGAEVCEVNNSTIPCIENRLNPSFSTGSPIEIIEKRMASPNGSGSSFRYESPKVVDSTNSLTVLSPVVFGSPLHLLQSVPKGKLPILPYSKMKKSVTSEPIQAKPSVGPTRVQTPCEVQITSPAVNVLNFSPLDSQPNLTSDPSIPVKQNCSFARKRGKKRKSYGEILGYQTKMRLVGSKLLTCKDKHKAQAEVAGKSGASSKKYRNIMPKPMAEIQSLASLSASNPLLHASMAECHLRNRLVGSRLQRWKQGDHSLLTPKSTAKVLYKCHVCDHSFQFKHHLQDHLNGHSNRRPYHCRLCRKAYVHSGSLSTHMKLHHSESRLKKMMFCEFCAKVFGHIRVYYGHLKEVHKVIVGTESSGKLEKKSLTLKGKPENSLLPQRNRSVSTEGDAVPRPSEEVRLQIRCGRCPFVAPAFSAMKLHLLGDHGDESQEVLTEGVQQRGRGVQEEAAEEATHHWKSPEESRNGAKGCGCLVRTGEEPLAAAAVDGLAAAAVDGLAAAAVDGLAARGSTPSTDGEEAPGLSSQTKFFCGDHFNCLLCSDAYKSRQEVLHHWEAQHNCENPARLWTLFASLPQNEQEIT